MSHRVADLAEHFAILLLLVLTSSSLSSKEPDERNPNSDNFLIKYCMECHSHPSPEGDFRIDLLLQTKSNDADLQKWRDLLERLESREMPPRGANKPTEHEYEQILAQIQEQVEGIERATISQQTRAMRRLNRDEYVNTINELFGIRYRPGDDFPIDGSVEGFDTNAEGLHLSSSLVEKYLNASNEVVARAFRLEDADHKPRVTKAIFSEENHFYPNEKQLGALSVYNGNAHLSFENAGVKRIVYIGGPSVFFYNVIDPIGNSQHAFNTEGVYRIKVTLTPRSFKIGEVASFTILGAEKRLVSEHDVSILENGKPITIEADGYYDRTEGLVGFELQWTNGNHLQWPSRGRLLDLPFDNSDQNKPWWHINYRIENGKRVEWKPQTPEELPFSYFERVEFEITGPIRETPSATAKLLGSYLQDEDAARVFERFLPRAFRRPVTPAEVQRYTSLVQQQRNKGLDATSALSVGIAAALCSPHFLFLIEAAPADSPFGSYLLSDHELASRLSYFLWSSCPDDELRLLADQGILHEPAQLNSQVSRMLGDPKVESFVRRFASQWLNLNKLSSSMPEPKLFPMWSDDLQKSCREESIAYFREILLKNRSIEEFLASNWTFLNEDLAAHYGLQPVEGRKLQRVELEDRRRGGLFTQAAILTLTSEATRTAPVIRGAYVLDRIFNRPPPPPPANINSLIPDASQARSVREHLSIHRSDASCAGCHARFDGFGLALENYDATGRWRTEELAYEDPSRSLTRTDQSQAQTFMIDATAEMLDGAKFDGILGLKEYLLSRKEDFLRGLAERLLIYGSGRKLAVADRPRIEAIVKEARMDGYKFHRLIQAVVDSQSFRTR